MNLINLIATFDFGITGLSAVLWRGEWKGETLNCGTIWRPYIVIWRPDSGYVKIKGWRYCWIANSLIRRSVWHPSWVQMLETNLKPCSQNNHPAPVVRIRTRTSCSMSEVHFIHQLNLELCWAIWSLALWPHGGDRLCPAWRKFAMMLRR